MYLRLNTFTRILYESPDRYNIIIRLRRRRDGANTAANRRRVAAGTFFSVRDATVQNTRGNVAVLYGHDEARKRKLTAAECVLRVVAAAAAAVRNTK